jgi:hypothetical protein
MRYMHKKNLIKAKLERCATEKPIKRPTYTELGQAVGMPPQGPWQPVLDSLARDAESAKEPDLTFLPKNARTGYPSRIGRTTKRNPQPWQRDKARTEMQRIIDKYNPGQANPFP